MNLETSFGLTAGIILFGRSYALSIFPLSFRIKTEFMNFQGNTNATMIHLQIGPLVFTVGKLG